MQKAAILTDSACDIPGELLKLHKDKVRILNFAITVDGNCYTEREDFTAEEYYEILRHAQGIPSTAHITSFRFFDVFLEYDKAGYTDLIVVPICASGSATNDAAHLAWQQFQEEYPQSTLNVHIIDSCCYSMAYGYPICLAAEKLQNEEPVESVLRFLEQFFASVEIVLTPYTLRFIKQSGRVSAAAAFAGDLLGLRPLITLNDGISKVKSKVRGDKQVLPALVNHLKQNIIPGKFYIVATTDYENGKKLAALCEKELGYPPVYITLLGACIATNTGPDTIALIFEGKPRR